MVSSDWVERNDKAPMLALAWSRISHFGAGHFGRARHYGGRDRAKLTCADRRIAPTRTCPYPANSCCGWFLNNFLSLAAVRPPVQPIGLAIDPAPSGPLFPRYPQPGEELPSL